MNGFIIKSQNNRQQTNNESPKNKLTKFTTFFSCVTFQSPIIYYNMLLCMHLISAYGDWKPLRTRKRRTHTIEKNLSDAADMIKIWRNKI